jgi:hypothetical protein
MGFDLTCRDLSLEKATNVAPGFGKMTGILEGEINDLEIDLATGQPIRFDASFRTVKRRDVKQTISGEAIELISLAGTQKAGAALLNLAGEHPYEAFGFAVKLRNDILHIEGVKQEDDRAVILVPPLIARTKIRVFFQPEIPYPVFEQRVREAIRSAQKAAETGDIKVEVK